jgi:SAM-dependent methyltransferase
VRDGVPRFFAPSCHEGEGTAEEARRFIEDARQLGWREAAIRRFADNRQMQVSLTDWQHAAWLPLLGLDEHSIAMDVGSGYGSITHWLARSVGRVFSLEAIPERIEFTRLRLEQEGLANVQLVQASALKPPFSGQIFDLIVVNGVLPWVGEWNRRGRPRDVQTRFLEALRSKLKPNGVLLMGTENRFGFQYLRGGKDHSGMAYTSLMPRYLANWYLRTRSETRREYRTYTYGAKGYRRLLADSGFGFSRIYWSDPTFNEPYSLIPLERQLVADHVADKLSEPTLPTPPGWRNPVKRIAAFAGLTQLVSPDLILLAGIGTAPVTGRLWQALRRSLPELPELRSPVFAMSTCSYKLRNLVRVFEEGSAELRCILKTTTPGPDSVAPIEQEGRAVGVASEQAARIPDPCFATPRPFGIARVGRFTYLAVSAVPGRSLSRLAGAGLAGRSTAILDRALPKCVQAAIQIAQTFCAGDRVGKLDPAWWNLPEHVDLHPDGACQIADLKHGWESGTESRSWVQHGDFTLQNICDDAASGKLAIVDWENMFQGGPPLYDLFTLLTIVGLGQDLPRGAQRYGGNTSQLHFESIFFDRNRWTSPFREWTIRACETLSIPVARAWPMFLQTLLFRRNYLKDRGSAYLANEYAGFLRIAGGKEDRFFLHL